MSVLAPLALPSPLSDAEVASLGDADPIGDDVFAGVLALAHGTVPPLIHSPTHHGPCPTRPVRVVLWDTQREVKLVGEDAPAEDDLLAYLQAHPHCTYFVGQRATAKRTAAQMAAFDLCAAAPRKVLRNCL